MKGSTRLLTVRQCSSTRSLVKKFRKHGIDYTLCNLEIRPIEDRKCFILEALSKSLNGFDSIVKNDVRQSGQYKLREENYSFNEMVEWLAKNPRNLNTPIMLHENHIIVGYQSTYDERILKGGK